MNLYLLVIRPTWKIQLFLIHRQGEFFFLILPTREANFGEKTFFFSNLQTSLGLPVTSFLKKWAIYNKTIILNLEHTFFLWGTFIFNDVSDWEWNVWKSVDLHWNFYGVKLKRMSIHEKNYNMQMNKAILRNSKIVSFDKKKNFVAAYNPLDLKQIFFAHQPK